MAMATSRSGNKLSHGDVVARYDQFCLKECLKMDLIVPLVVKRLILKPKLGKRLQEENDIPFFLAILKKKPVHKFVKFLQCLAETFPYCEEHLTLVKAMSSDLLIIDAPPELLSVVEEIVAAAEAVTPSKTTEQAALEETETGARSVSLLQPHNLPSSGETNQPPEMLEHPDQPETAGNDPLSESKTLALISGEFERLSLASESSDHEQDTAAAVNETSTFSPPGGFIEPCASKSFGREGGVFYCSSHGLKIDIPPGAILPSEPDGQYKISMHAYVKGPFHIPAIMDVDPFAAVFLLDVNSPQQKFRKHVKLQMPHCAIVNDESGFVVLRASRPKDSKSDSYVFSEVLEADCLEDGYHLEVSVDHFSAFVCGRQRSSMQIGKCHHSDSPKSSRQRKLRNSGKQRMPDATKVARQMFATAKGSLEQSSSFDAPQSDKQEQPTESPSDEVNRLPLPSSQDTVGGDQPGGPVGVERALSVKEGPSCELCVAKWRPQICGRSWEEVFLVAGAHPTGKLVRELWICVCIYSFACLYHMTVYCEQV